AAVLLRRRDPRRRGGLRDPGDRRWDPGAAGDRRRAALRRRRDDLRRARSPDAARAGHGARGRPLPRPLPHVGGDGDDPRPAPRHGAVLFEPRQQLGRLRVARGVRGLGGGQLHVLGRERYGARDVGRAGAGRSAEPLDPMTGWGKGRETDGARDNETRGAALGRPRGETMKAMTRRWATRWAAAVCVMGAVAGVALADEGARVEGLLSGYELVPTAEDWAKA